MDENYSEVAVNELDESDIHDEVEVVESSDVVIEKPKSKRQIKKELKKEKKIKKLKFKYLERPDIKYRGPLSYRHLRFLAWFFLALTQMATLNNICVSIFPDNPILGPIGGVAMDFIVDLTVPLFMIATFATILNRNKSFKNILVFYFASWLGLGLVIVLIYQRYISAALSYLEGSQYAASVVFGNHFGHLVEKNVFADLLALTSFYFFIAYDPKKHFQGKKICIFRMFAIIPLAVAFFSYIVKVQSNFGRMELPFEVYPFLTTKPPLLYFLFIGISLVLKRTERIFVKIGSSKKQFLKYSLTNRNSLSISIRISILVFIISLLDILIFAVYGTYKLYVNRDIDYDLLLLYADASNYEIGQCAGLMFVIPFILLFSYNRRYSDKTTDLIIPIIGLALLAWVYIEGIYQIIRRFLVI